MAQSEFIVEFVHKGSGTVIARQMDTNPFELIEGAKLGDVRLAPVVKQPSAVDAEGNPRHDLFLFRAQPVSGARRLEVGQRVPLVLPVEE